MAEIYTRELEKDDKAEFMRVCEQFFHESYHKDGDIDLEAWWKLVSASFKVGYVSIPCAFHGSEMVGFAIINYNTEFKKQREGELSKFYIMPEWRKTGVSRILAQVVVNIFDEWGCSDTHLWAAPQLEGSDHNISLFKNLWARYGYKETGIIMTRKGKSDGR